ncbi:MAG: hypothetical protein LBG22_10580, partial [Treponema sp.]|nr:hypothetical protein [Treponema sp.]
MKTKQIILAGIILMISIISGNVFAAGKSDGGAKGGVKEVVCIIQAGSDTDILKSIADAYNAEPG